MVLRRHVLGVARGLFSLSWMSGRHPMWWPPPETGSVLQVRAGWRVAGGGLPVCATQDAQSCARDPGGRAAIAQPFPSYSRTWVCLPGESALSCPPVQVCLLRPGTQSTLPIPQAITSWTVGRPKVKHDSEERDPGGAVVGLSPSPLVNAFGMNISLCQGAASRTQHVA